MALPEHEVAAFKPAIVRARFTQFGLNPVPLTPGGGQRGLGEAGAVDPLRCPAAPEIGCLQEALGDRDEVRLAKSAVSEMTGPDMQSVMRDSELALLPHDRELRAERKRHTRG